MSVSDWLDGLHFLKPSKESVLVWLSQMENLPWDLTTISALYACVLVYVRLHAPSDTGKLIPQTFRWEGGTGVLVQALRKKLAKLGVYTFEQHPASKVKYDDNGVTITFKGQDTELKAQQAVFAVAPCALAKNVEFEPALPQEYTDLNNAMKPWSDPAYNVVLTFESTFWKTNEKQKNYLPSPLGQRDPHSWGPNPVPEKDRVFGAVMDLTPAKSKKGTKNGVKGDRAKDERS